MLKPADLLLSAVVAIGLFSLILGALVAGAGLAAVRRQWRQLALLAMGMGPVALALPLLDQQAGGALGIVVLAFSLLFAARQLQRRNEPAEVTERRRAVMRSPRWRLLMASLVVFTVLVVALATTLGRSP
ncbi:MAG: hypothetical protein ACRDMH_17445 [Solirubrobacterales bacterium]